MGQENSVSALSHLLVCLLNEIDSLGSFVVRFKEQKIRVDEDMDENVLLKLILSLIRNPVMEKGKQNHKKKVKKREKNRAIAQ